MSLSNKRGFPPWKKGLPSRRKIQTKKKRRSRDDGKRGNPPDREGEGGPLSSASKKKRGISFCQKERQTWWEKKKGGRGKGVSQVSRRGGKPGSDHQKGKRKS